MKEHEIWVGYYVTGQSKPPINPTLVGKLKAPSFKIACLIHEHRLAIANIIDTIKKGDIDIENNQHFGMWYYNPNSNSNSFYGKYFETEKEAWQTFPDIWYLTKRPKDEEGTFELMDLPKSEKHEEQVPYFKDFIEENLDVEIYEIKGHQFITSDGVYVIVNDKEVEPVE